MTNASAGGSVKDLFIGFAHDRGGKILYLRLYHKGADQKDSGGAGFFLLYKSYMNKTTANARQTNAVN